jgi:DNA-binding beta-propeller fold protein YncE
MGDTGSAEPLRIPTCALPRGVALSKSDGRLAYVACGVEDALAIVDTTDPTAAAQNVPLAGAAGSDPRASASRSIAMDPSGNELLVIDSAATDLTKIDTETAAVVGNAWPLSGAYSSAWSPDGSIVAVVTRGPEGVSLLDAHTGSIEASRTFGATECDAPREAAFGADYLYVLCAGSSNAAVLSIDASTADLAITARYALDDRAEGFLVLRP